MARIIVQGELCQGHGRCYSLSAPELFEADDLGFALPRDEEIDVGVAQLGAARDAVMSCPEGAIRLVED